MTQSEIESYDRGYAQGLIQGKVDERQIILNWFSRMGMEKAECAMHEYLNELGIGGQKQ